VLGIGILLEGEMHGTAGAAPFRVGAGEILLLDAAQPSKVSLSVSRSIQLVVPRTVAIEAGFDVPTMHGTVIRASAATMLVSHVRRVREALPYLRPDEGPRVARTMLDMLVLAVSATSRSEASAEAPVSSLALRARNEIRANLGSPSLTIANLCRRLHVSRSTLHRLFEAEGGVQASIRNTRLDAARLALLDPEMRERIGDLAERLGFSDAAHLSRLFRARFGETPSACRARAGMPEVG
jgi:AraC-like DNA-binding protein